NNSLDILCTRQCTELPIRRLKHINRREIPECRDGRKQRCKTIMNSHTGCNTTKDPNRDQISAPKFKYTYPAPSPTSSNFGAEIQTSKQRAGTHTFRIQLHSSIMDLTAIAQQVGQNQLIATRSPCVCCRTAATYVWILLKQQAYAK